MFCTHCGVPLERHYNFCYQCGHASFAMNKNDYYSNKALPISNSLPLLKKSPKKNIIIGLMFLLSLLLLNYFLGGNDELTRTAQGQLSKIKQNELSESYFAYMSNDFKSHTPLKNFRTFIITHPVFLKAKQAFFTQSHAKGTKGNLFGFIMADNNECYPVSYRFVLEDDSWKIDDIKIDMSAGKQLAQMEPLKKRDLLKESFLQETQQPFDFQPLLDVIQTFSKKMDKDSYKEVYKDFFSTEFKNSINLKEFEDFLKRHPELVDSKITITKKTFDNNVAIFEGAILAKNQRVYPIAFDLVFENNHWVIQRLEIDQAKRDNKQPFSSTTDSAKMTAVNSQQENEGLIITTIHIGTEIEQKDIETHNASQLQSLTDDLHITLYVENGHKGDEIELTLINFETQGQIPPQQSTLATDGNAVLSYIFAAPKDGWPRGEYELKARASNDTFASYTFTINVP